MKDTLDPNHPVRKHPYTTTLSGVNVYSPNQFKACEVRVSDILDGISKICRFNGQVSEFYSVAEHSVLVSRIAELLDDEEAVIPALFHDAHEAYSGDIPTPHKRMVPALLGFEKGYEERVREALGLAVPGDHVWMRVAKYDAMILHRELRTFRAPELLPRWYDPQMDEQVPQQIQPVGFEWRQARAMFRDRIHDLGWGLGGNI
jgi:hypothetical protein